MESFYDCKTGLAAMDDDGLWPRAAMGVSAPPSAQRFSDGMSRRAHGFLRRFARPLSTRATNPRASRRNVCPQKYE
jgi:hypothetical protein